MDTFESEEGYVVVSLETGDDALESIEAACEKHDVDTGAVVSAIGTLRNLNVHYLTTDDLTADRSERNEVLELDGCWEVSGIQGLIADGEPHLHVTADDGDRTVAGHLEPGCEVNALAEILIRRIDDLELGRTRNEFDVSTLSER
jgi:hypothetical protein